MSLTQPYQYFGYNPYSSAPYQSYPSQNIPSLQPYSYLYSNSPISVSNTTLNQHNSVPSCKNQSTNTLFVKNLPFEMSSAEVKKKFGEFGELAFIKSQVHDRGIAFITYYDMRSAEKAYEKLHGTEFFGRRLVVDFSFKKNNHNNQNISLYVIIEILDYSQAISLNLDIIKNYMASFGEIYNAYAFSPYKYVIKYYDFRSSQNAARYGNTLSINGVKCNIYVPEEDPDLPPPPTQSISTSIQAAPLNKADVPTIAVNATTGNPYSAYASSYNPYNYQNPQYQQQSVNQQVQPIFNSYQQPQQPILQSTSQISIQNQQIVTAQTQQILGVQPHQVLAAQPQQIIASQPQQILTSQPQQILTSQPQQILAAQPQQILAAQPQQIIASQPQQILTSQPQQLIASQSQQHQMLTAQQQHIRNTSTHQAITAQSQQMLTTQQQAPTIQPTPLQQNAPALTQEAKNTIPASNSTNDAAKESFKKLNMMMSQKSAF